MRSLVVWIGLILSILIIGCSDLYHQRFMFGELLPSQACIAVLPLVDLNNTAAVTNNKEDLLSEYLALAMGNAGLEAVIGPRDVDNLFQQANLTSPAGINQEQAIKLGKVFAAQAVIFGNFMKLPLQKSSTPVGEPDLLVGADIYLMDIEANAISWMYSSRFYVSQVKYLEELAKLSNDMTQSLLASTAGRVSLTSKGGCWDRPRIVQALQSRGNKVVPILAEAPKAPVKTPEVAPSKAKAKKLKLALEVQPYYNKLVTNQPVTATAWFEGRSTAIKAKNSAEVKNLALAMLALAPSSQFVLEGHVDETSSSSDDFWVSAQQASKLRDLLYVESEALNGRIQISSKGASAPVMPNVNQKSREKNRRIILSLSNPNP